jgi:hypothetical protein
MLDSAADAADIIWILLRDEDALARLREQIARRQACWSCADDRHAGWRDTVG